MPAFVICEALAFSHKFVSSLDSDAAKAFFTEAALCTQLEVHKWKTIETRVKCFGRPYDASAAGLSTATFACYCPPAEGDVKLEWVNFCIWINPEDEDCHLASEQKEELTYVKDAGKSACCSGLICPQCGTEVKSQQKLT